MEQLIANLVVTTIFDHNTKILIIFDQMFVNPRFLTGFLEYYARKQYHNIAVIDQSQYQSNNFLTYNHYSLPDEYKFKVIEKPETVIDLFPDR